MVKAKITDQCLWIAHVEAGPLREALSSIHPDGVISLTVDGDEIAFQRMAMGRDGRQTNGFNPVGSNAGIWRSRYAEGHHIDIDLDFAGRING